MEVEDEKRMEVEEEQGMAVKDMMWMETKKDNLRRDGDGEGEGRSSKGVSTSALSTQELRRVHLS